MAVVVSVGWLGCYDVPRPACGFRCGPSEACPADYSCAADGRCHLNGSPSTLVCATPDAAIPGDAYSPNARLIFPIVGVNLNPADAILVEFDVDVANVGAATFTVEVTGTSLPVVGNVSYTPTTRQASFSNPEGLPPATSLTVTLTSEILAVSTLQPLKTTTFDIITDPDSTPPRVLVTTPPTGTTGISVGTNVTFGFSEPMINVTTSTVTLRDSAMNPIPATVTYDANTRTATLDPIDQLAANEVYTGRAGSGITDVSGNAILNAQFLMNFTTGADALPPTVRLTAPANNDTNIAPASNIVVTFDEPVMNVDTTSFQVNGGAITGTVTMSNGNRVATFDPTADMPAASMIDVTLGTAITDTSGNALAAPVAFSFTTN